LPLDGTLSAPARVPTKGKAPNRAGLALGRHAERGHQRALQGQSAPAPTTT